MLACNETQLRDLRDCARSKIHLHPSLFSNPSLHRPVIDSSNRNQVDNVVADGHASLRIQNGARLPGAPVSFSGLERGREKAHDHPAKYFPTARSNVHHTATDEQRAGAYRLVVVALSEVRDVRLGLQPKHKCQQAADAQCV
eukprot:1130376-Rhodomonas_salina.2